MAESDRQLLDLDGSYARGEYATEVTYVRDPSSVTARGKAGCRACESRLQACCPYGLQVGTHIQTVKWLRLTWGKIGNPFHSPRKCLCEGSGQVALDPDVEVEVGICLGLE